MTRPFDVTLRECMIATMVRLVEETNATCGYTQSDEITLILHSDDPKSMIWFGGKHSKIVSQSAALATLFFFQEVQERMPDYACRNPTFDSRVFQVPNKREAVNCVIWREWDATKNSVSMAAQTAVAAHSKYGKKALHGKHQGQQMDILMDCGINWNDYPDWAKRGTYARRKRVDRKFTESEMHLLPEKHQARKDPNLVVSRTKVVAECLPILTTITNKEEVLFDGKEPILESGEKAGDAVESVPV